MNQSHSLFENPCVEEVPRLLISDSSLLAFESTMRRIEKIENEELLIPIEWGNPQ